MTTRLVALISILVAGAACSEMRSPEAPTPLPAAPTPPVTTPMPSAPVAPATARYEVTFTSTWTPASHPIDYPADAHWSALIGTAHAASVTFWREGEFASAGIRAMAERGRANPFDQEVQAAVSAGTASGFVNTGTPPTAGPFVLEMEVSQAHPLVTLVTMIAPSPDWFVGAGGVALFEGGAWVSERDVPLVPFDAGTDSGETYSSPDRETRPAQPIARIAGFPLAVSGVVAPFGTLTFKRLP